MIVKILSVCLFTFGPAKSEKTQGVHVFAFSMATEITFQRQINIFLFRKTQEDQTRPDANRFEIWTKYFL